MENDVNTKEKPEEACASPSTESSRNDQDKDVGCNKQSENDGVSVPSSSQNATDTVPDSIIIAGTPDLSNGTCEDHSGKDSTATLNNFMNDLDVATKKSNKKGCNKPKCSTQDSETLVCNTCNANVHFECTRLPGYQIHKFIHVSRYRNYVCEICSGDIPPKYCIGDNIRKDVIALQESSERLNADWKKVVDEKDELIAQKENMITSLKETINENKSTSQQNVVNNSDAFQILKDENTELLDKVETFKKECNLLLGRVRSLESTHEDLEGKVRNSKLILEKAEETIKTKSELIDAKNEIIDNLKIRTRGDTTIENTIQATEDKMVQSENEKYGVKECCEYLSIHANNGVALNSLLLWVDIQRQLHPENHWKALAIKGFLDSEITEAKELLWRTSDITIIGKMTKRQGATKKVSEVNDICVALKKLSEKDCVPMFISTSGMVAQTPIFNSRPLRNDSDVTNEKLNNIDESIKSLKNDLVSSLNQKDDIHPHAPDDDENSSSDECNVENRCNLALGGTISVTEISGQPNSGNEDSDGGDWTEQMSQQQKRKKQNSIRGTGNVQFAATSSLVIYGVSKDINADLIIDYLRRKNIEVSECVLLTKHEQPRSLSYKLTVKAVDLQKANNPNTWPNGVGIRMFNEPNERRNDQASNTFNRKKKQVNDNKNQARNSVIDKGLNSRNTMMQADQSDILNQLQQLQYSAAVSLGNNRTHPSNIVAQQPVWYGGEPTLTQQQPSTPQPVWYSREPTSYIAPQNNTIQSLQLPNIPASTSLQNYGYHVPHYSRSNIFNMATAPGLSSSNSPNSQPKLRFVDRLGADTFAQSF